MSENLRTETQRVIRNAVLNPAQVQPSYDLSSLSPEDQARFALELETTWKALGLGDSEATQI